MKDKEIGLPMAELVDRCKNLALGLENRYRQTYDSIDVRVHVETRQSGLSSPVINLVARFNVFHAGISTETKVQTIRSVITEYRWFTFLKAAEHAFPVKVL